MNKNWMGYLLIGAGILLLTRGHFFFFPLLWIPLIWLLFRGFFGGRQRAWGYGGGACGPQQLATKPTPEARTTPQTPTASETTTKAEDSYTGETTRL